MSPLPETSGSKSTISTSFFDCISTQGHPSIKERGHKWKDLFPKADNKKAEEAEGKMVVQCSERHDYGKHSPSHLVGTN
jgi:hypothetical protein